MDSANLSASIIRELGEMFVEALTQVGPELLTSDLDGIEQRPLDEHLGIGAGALSPGLARVASRLGSRNERVRSSSPSGGT